MSRPRVLLADDYPGMLDAVRRLLACDYEVVGAVADGHALLEAARRLAPDVVVLDLNLPKAHGLDACREVAASPKTKVIVYTAMNDPDVKQQALAVGASAFVSKLGPVDGLLSEIKRVVESA